MPRGRKRKTEAPVLAVPQGPKSDEEEVFVDIDGDAMPLEEEEAQSSSRGKELRNETSEIVAGNGQVAKRGPKKRKLPVPRLVTPEVQSAEIKPKKNPPRARRPTVVHEAGVSSSKKSKIYDFPESELAETCSSSCIHCGQQLFSEMENFEHQRGFHKELIKSENIPTGTLLCSHPHCSTSFPDVAHLIAHLVAFHSQHQFRIRKKSFESIDKFWDWKNNYERSNRCKFMGTAMPEGTSTEIFEFTNYCEFCDDWREQDLKGPPVPEQIPKKIFGCPSYFTATIDNKKKKATIVGCLSHLGHHKRNSYSTEAKEPEIRRTDTTTTANIKCDLCEMMFRSRSAATRHHRMVHQAENSNDPNKKTLNLEPKLPSLECADPDCATLCDSMVTLVAHVAEAHNVEVEVNEYKFENMAAFETWKSQMENETTSRFCKVSGRVLPNEITKYYLCHLSGHTNRSKRTAPTEKQRNRPTKKMGRYCTAFMSFKQNKVDGTIHVKGCLKHFGHKLDVRRLPIPEQVRKEISEMLLKGMLEDDVVQQIRGLYSENERGYWIQRYEVRNIALKMQREGLIFTKTYVDGMDGVWDPMGFPEEGSYVLPYVPVRSHTKLVQYKPVVRNSEGHEDRPTHSRYVTSRAKMESMEVVQYVDTEYVDEEEQLVALEDGEVYYQEDLEEGAVIEEDGTRVIPIQEHVVVTEEAASSNPGSRKRMPLLKEPMKTGNAAFDDVMVKMKNRFNKISGQLRETRDMRLAQGMLKELQELQQRMGVGHNEILDDWTDEFVYTELDDEEYHLDQVEAQQEEEEGRNDEEDGYEEYDEDVVVHVDNEVEEEVV